MCDAQEPADLEIPLCIQSTSGLQHSGWFTRFLGVERSDVLHGPQGYLIPFFDCIASVGLWATVEVGGEPPFIEPSADLRLSPGQKLRRVYQQALHRVHTPDA